VRLLGVVTSASSQPVVPVISVKARLFELFPTKSRKILELDQVSNNKKAWLNK